MNHMINMKALYTDETKQYLMPPEAETGDMVTVRFRSGKDDLDAVFLISGELRIRMNKVGSEGCFDFYEVPVTVGKTTMRYGFELFKGEKRIFYNRLGVTQTLHEALNFSLVPGFKTPAWAKGAVMYQIFVDRFCNGDPSNDVEDGEYCYIKQPVERVKDWYAYPKARDIGSFYGGDLQGILDKLDYLVDLGVEVIYMNPIFVSPSNHKYDCQDYEYVDPHYTVIKKDGGQVLGDSLENCHATKYIQRVTDRENLEASNAFFARFVEEVHRRGLKIILDGVFNHCGSFHKWMDRDRLYEQNGGYEAGAYVSEESPYRDFFRFDREDGWPCNDSYQGWWNHKTLPKLAYENSEELYRYILGIAKKWLTPPYCVDGWRLDVAADLGNSAEFNHMFWRDFRRAVKEVNPEAVIYAEHYGDVRPWMKGDEWDSVMNYDAFMEPLTWYLTGMEKHSDGFCPERINNREAFQESMSWNLSAFHMPSLQMAMNQLSNHDHSRFLTRTSHVVGRTGTCGPEAADHNVQKCVMREAVVFQMTWPGAPTLYYGDEAGLCGFTDPDNRRTYPWGREDRELLAFHREMIRIHREHPMLREGSCKFISAGYQLLAFGRFDAQEQIIVVLNNYDEEVTADVAVWEAGVPQNGTLLRLMLSRREDYTVEAETYAVQDGLLRLSMPPKSAMVLWGSCMKEL